MYCSQSSALGNLLSHCSLDTKTGLWTQSKIVESEKEVLEDLIIAAINDANKKVSENMTQQLGSLSGGMGLPPGIKLPF